MQKSEDGQDGFDHNLMDNRTRIPYFVAQFCIFKLRKPPTIYIHPGITRGKLAVFITHTAGLRSHWVVHPTSGPPSVLIYMHALAPRIYYARDRIHIAGCRIVIWKGLSVWADGWMDVQLFIEFIVCFLSISYLRSLLMQSRYEILYETKLAVRKTDRPLYSGYSLCYPQIIEHPRFFIPWLYIVILYGVYFVLPLFND